VPYHPLFTWAYSEEGTCFDNQDAIQYKLYNTFEYNTLLQTRSCGLYCIDIDFDFDFGLDHPVPEGYIYEEGYNTPTVALRVVRDDVKGAQCPGV
jgi:hypothetical protein